VTDLVTDAVRQALDLGDGFELADHAGPDDIPGWDSLGWVKILGLIEEISGTELPLDRLADAQTIGDLKNVLKDL
jgi:acyl carrier protein